MATEAKPEIPTGQVPDWVKAELFEDVLRQTVAGFSKIKSFNVKSGSAAGENYATVMLRVYIEVELEDGKEKSVSYMLKLPLQVAIFQAMMEKNNIFEAERTVYKIVVPEMEQMYRDVGVEVKFGAQIYELQGAKTDYILLEDLAPRGFKNQNRLEGLDQVHTETALRQLAKWHAASATRVANKGAYTKQLMEGFYREENRPIMEEMNKHLADNFVKCCATYEGNEEYYEQVKALQPKLNDEIFKMTKIDSNAFNALNHGDFWSNNMMFSHDSFGKIKDILFVDFQLPKYGTIAQDLYYFLISSTKFEDKLSKFEYYIKFYHEQLADNLKLLKYPKAVPTLRDIHLSLFKNGLWGYLTASNVMSGVLMDPSESASVLTLTSDSAEANDFKTLIYTNARYRKHIQAIMPWLRNRGALDV